EKMLRAAAKDAEGLKGKLKREKVGTSNFLTLTLDGSMIPWDNIPLKDVEDKEGEFNDLVKQVKASKLVVSLGVHRGFLCLWLGSGGKSRAVLGGKGKKLEGVAELKPLMKHAKKRLASIGYSSKAFRVKTGGSPADLSRVVEPVKKLLAK